MKTLILSCLLILPTILYSQSYLKGMKEYNSTLKYEKQIKQAAKLNKGEEEGF